MGAGRGGGDGVIGVLGMREVCKEETPAKQHDDD
jgi:hypothetical protein